MTVKEVIKELVDTEDVSMDRELFVRIASRNASGTVVSDQVVEIKAVVSTTRHGGPLIHIEYSDINTD